MKLVIIVPQLHGHASIGLARLQHLTHLKLAFSTSLPWMLVHFLYTQCSYPEQKTTQLKPRHTRSANTTRPHTESNNMLIFWPLNMSLIFFMFTLNPLFFKLTFQDVNHNEVLHQSSPYNNSQGHPVLNSWDSGARTMMKRSRLRTEPWHTPTFTQKLPLK